MAKTAVHTPLLMVIRMRRNTIFRVLRCGTSLSVSERSQHCQTLIFARCICSPFKPRSRLPREEPGHGDADAYVCKGTAGAIRNSEALYVERKKRKKIVGMREAQGVKRGKNGQNVRPSSGLIALRAEWFLAWMSRM